MSARDSRLRLRVQTSPPAAPLLAKERLIHRLMNKFDPSLTGHLVPLLDKERLGEVIQPVKRFATDF